MLKLRPQAKEQVEYQFQPPSGGCVLKHDAREQLKADAISAAFGRLCVETFDFSTLHKSYDVSRLRAAVC